MNKNIENQRINYIDCPHQGLHTGEQLNLICLTGECPENGLICPICKEEKHKKHKVVQLKKFIYDVNQTFQNQEKIQDVNIDDLLQNVEIIQQENLYALKKFVESISEKVKTMEESLVSSYQVIKQRLISQQQMSQNLPLTLESILNGDYTTFSKYNTECRKIIDSVKIQQNSIKFEYNPSKLLKKFAYTKQQFTQNIQNLEKIFSDNVKVSTNLIDQAKNLEDFSDNKKQLIKNLNGNQFLTNLKFSQDLTSKQIKIKSQCAEQTSSTHAEQRIALADPELSKTGKSYFAFHIKKYINWVGVGISFKKVLQNLDFKFKYQQIGHGSYFASSNGFTWSHSKKIQNSSNTNSGFKFGQNDIILCELDADNKKLTLVKNLNESLKCVFEDIEIPANDSIHASVNICNPGETVELLPWKEQYNKFYDIKSDELNQYKNFLDKSVLEELDYFGPNSLTKQYSTFC